MSTPRLTKLRKQQDSTWVLHQKHLIALPHPFQKLFQTEVWNFIANKFNSLSKNVGYVSTSILTMMAFIAGSASTVSTETQEMPLNLYSIIFSLQTFGKTQANKEYAISPMIAVFSIRFTEHGYSKIHIL